ncbi:hypothetical protein KHC23_13000 [Ancylobacter dichloromethanicus]|uniref:Uncharacterized protein n=1 Tax=Ancylobacter dichloromethanicus TaxID=518825 RepID=A0A9W6J6H7_9HYPH|nr:hypothetical protein [Ancylobacter dichloromethanicus]MBS7554571.1 hypothetical protein [Ancylobacter dichloromethanicus]GLK71701.1 hypothetical protein GCM10017643_18160 [Ancylobacter dichloromethanicus]
MDADVVSKGQFAQLANVSAGRVSQWIAEGKLSGGALVGEGRAARIRVSVAQSQLRARIDVGQRFGNGINTKLTATAETSPAVPSAPAIDPIEERIKQAKLREIEFKNRESAEKEFARKGLFILAKDASDQMAAIVGAMLNVFEGALPDLAAAIASQFHIPQRDVLHLLRREVRAIRERAALAARKKMESLPGDLQVEIPETEHRPETVD